jgi:hypothetical protein
MYIKRKLEQHREHPKRYRPTTFGGGGCYRKEKIKEGNIMYWGKKKREE